MRGHFLVEGPRLVGDIDQMVGQACRLVVGRGEAGAVEDGAIPVRRPDAVVGMLPFGPGQHRLDERKMNGRTEGAERAARIAAHVFGIDDNRRLSRPVGHAVEQRCLLGKAGRARYYSAYEKNVGSLRRALILEVKTLASKLNPQLPAPATELVEPQNETEPTPPWDA